MTEIDLKTNSQELGSKIIFALRTELEFQQLDADKFEIYTVFPPAGNDLQWWVNIGVEVIAKDEQGGTLFLWNETMPIHGDAVQMLFSLGVSVFVTTFFTVRFSKYVKGVFTQARRLEVLHKPYKEVEQSDIAPEAVQTAVWRRGVSNLLTEIMDHVGDDGDDYGDAYDMALIRNNVRGALQELDQIPES